MNALVFRSAEGHITAPLIGDCSAIHHTSHDTEHLIVKEEFWNKARWLERQRQKVAIGAAVGLVAVVLKIPEENRPKRVSASIDQAPRKLSFEYAIALVLDLGDLVLNPFQLACPPWSTSVT